MWHVWILRSKQLFLRQRLFLYTGHYFTSISFNLFNHDGVFLWDICLEILSNLKTFGYIFLGVYLLEAFFKGVYSSPGVLFLGTFRKLELDTDSLRAKIFLQKTSSLL